MSEEKARLLEQIKDLIPINKLPPNLQARLLDQAQVLEVNKSRFLFKQGDRDNYSYFLLEGEIELLAGKQGGDLIKGGSERARYALARIQPRQFSAQARTRARVLIIERNSLDQLLMLADQSGLGASSAVADDMGVDSIDAASDADWMTQLLQSGLFSRMPMANIQQLFSRLEPVEYEAGAVVIRQGDPGDYYYIISEGRCAVSRKPSARSNDVKIAELGIGDSFGEEALISNSKRNATITMQSAGVVMRLGKDDFVELIKTPTLQALTYKEALALIGQGGQWLDVRFPDEYRDSAIAGSVNIPLQSLRLESAKLDEAKRYVLYCDTAKRSSAGAFLLAERGFEVAYLEGGLLNNPAAIEAGAPAPKPPAPKAAKSAPPPVAEAAEVDAGVRVEILNAELETTQMRMRVAREQAGKDIDQKKELEALQKQLGEARKKLERQKKEAEAEAKKKAREEEQRLKAFTAEAEKKMQQEKRQLEDIYNKNAREMERLQKATQAAREKTRKEKEKLERQAAAVTQQIAEAQRLKSEIEASKQSLEQQVEQKRRENERHEKDLQEKARAGLDEERRKLAEQYARNVEEFEALKKEKAEVEASKQSLEQQAEQKRRENERHEKELQEKAKAGLDEERRKLAEQYARNVEEFEALKKEKAAVEASRLAARKEAQKIVSEYKLQHDQSHAEEEARLKAERRKLEQEAKKIQQTMIEIHKIRLEAELVKQEAEAEALRLRERQMDEIGSQAQQEQLSIEIRAAREKVAEAQKNIEDAMRREKQAVSARQENEADLRRKKQEQEALLARIKADLAHFEKTQQEEAATITTVLVQADHMRRIKDKAEEAKRRAALTSANLLDDISRQLSSED